MHHISVLHEQIKVGSVHRDDCLIAHNRTKKYDLDSQDNAAFNFQNEKKKDK